MLLASLGLRTRERSPEMNCELSRRFLFGFSALGGKCVGADSSIPLPDLAGFPSRSEAFTDRLLYVEGRLYESSGHCDSH